jgi:hypothetical protein
MEKKIKLELKKKLIDLVSQFEVSRDWGRVAGNFDGQILSYGPLQWNIGQSTLFYVLKRIPQEVLEKYLGSDFVKSLSSNSSLRYFVLHNILGKNGNVLPGWSKKFSDLAKEPSVISAFVVSAEPYFIKSNDCLNELGFTTERGAALCFDITVQNGGLRKDHKILYTRYISTKNPQNEWEKYKILANVIAELANPQWKNDVLNRKLTIALGKGSVHGVNIDLEKDFDISYNRTWYM